MKLSTAIKEAVSMILIISGLCLSIWLFALLLQII